MLSQSRLCRIPGRRDAELSVYSECLIAEHSGRTDTISLAVIVMTRALALQSEQLWSKDGWRALNLATVRDVLRCLLHSLCCDLSPIQ